MEQACMFDDVLMYENIISAESGYPIYMLFEIIKVYRKNAADLDKERSFITKKLK